jgi:hypothetical protein
MSNDDRASRNITLLETIASLVPDHTVGQLAPEFDSTYPRKLIALLIIVHRSR